jgi:hypothetical protein
LGGSDDQAEVIDLMELTAIVMIPLLLKAAAVTKGQDLPANVVPPPEKILEMAVKIILHDVTGSQETRQTLTPEFLRQILRLYGETEMAQDDKLIQEMILAASGGLPSGSKDFNAEIFAEGLTKDVELYSISNEVRMSTSVQDVFDDNNQGPARSPGAVSNTHENLEQGLVIKKEKVRQIETLNHIYTAPAIDMQAGTFRSKGTYPSRFN